MKSLAELLGDSVSQESENTLREYLEIQTRISELEAQKSVLKGVIEAWMKRDGTNALEVNGYTAVVADITRENFNLKAAKAVIAFEILKPYVTQTTYSRLTVRSLK